jgi:hypothetical protein
VQFRSKTIGSSDELKREVQAGATPKSSGALTRQFRNATPSSLGEITREVHGQFMLAYAEVQGVHGKFRVSLRGSSVSAQIFKLR